MLVLSLCVFENAIDYAQLYDSAASAARSSALRKEGASVETWKAIIDQYPRCRVAVAGNDTVSFEILERLRADRDFRVQWSVRIQKRWQDVNPDDVKPFDFDLDELVEYDLTDIERNVLWHGLLEWGGPAKCTEELAVAMGFLSVSDLLSERRRIMDAIKKKMPMTHVDWARTMVATEIVFMSDTVGAASDWEIVSGLSDLETFATIRGLQSHLLASPLIGKAFGTRYKPEAYSA